VFLQYFDTVGWVFWPVKTVACITYTVLVETLNHAQSINQSTTDHGARSTDTNLVIATDWPSKPEVPVQTCDNTQSLCTSYRTLQIASNSDSALT